MISRDPSLAIQAAVYKTLTTWPDLVAYFAPNAVAVYDRVPGTAGQPPAYPYITIGEDQVIGHTNQNTDPSEVWAKVEIWSRSQNKTEVKLLADIVRQALDRDIGLTMGHGIIAHTFHNTIYRREPDGLTERAILTQRYITAPIGALAYSGG
jgi:Protein of unknown function (DUF3168)